MRTLLLEQAGELLGWIIESEFQQFLAQHAKPPGSTRQAAVVRNGRQPPRKLLTGLGPVTIRIPKNRSRSSRPLTFHSRLARPYMRRARIPIGQASLQYLRGLRSGDLHATITALVGPEAAALPGTVMRQVRDRWNLEHRDRLRGPLAWLAAGELWLHAERAEGDAACVLVAIASGQGREHIVALTQGGRRSIPAWSALMSDLRDRGLPMPTQLRIDHDLVSVIRSAIASAYPIHTTVHPDAAPVRTYTRIDP